MTQTLSNNTDEKFYKLTRANLNNRAQFKKKIEDFLGPEYINDFDVDNNTFILFNRSRIHDIASFMKRTSFNLDNIFLTDNITSFELNYVYSCREHIPNSIVILQTTITKNINPPSISDIYLAAELFEKYNNQRFGVLFNRPKSSKIEEKKHFFCKPLSIQPPTASDNPFKFGLFHDIHQNNNYFDGYIENNSLKALELRDGWLYKKIQPKLEKSNPLRSFYSPLEKISEFSNVALNLAYYMNLETLLEVKIPNKVKYIRTLLAELERVGHHLIWILGLSNLLGNRYRAKKIYDIIKILLEQYRRFFNNPYLLNTIKFGSSIDINKTDAQKLGFFFEKNKSKIFRTGYKIVYDYFSRKSLKGIGIISGEDALNSGISGPSLRGSGKQIDVRTTEPYLVYDKGEVSQLWNIMSFSNDDCFGRAQVRLWEIKESLAIIEYILESLSVYERKIKLEPLPNKKKLPKNKNLYSSIEGPNGRINMYLKTNKDKNTEYFYTTRILTPDRIKYDNINTILLGENPKYIPLIIHSFDINFNMLDL